MLIASYSSAGLAELRSGKAVYETSNEKGMKLTESALKNIEVKSTKVSGASLHILPKESLVYFQDEIGVYRRRDNWFKLVKIQVIKKGPSEVTIRSSELQNGDEIAIHGADLLRVSEMDAFGSGE